MSCQAGSVLQMAIGITVAKERKHNYILYKKTKLEDALGLDSSGLRRTEKNEIFIDINSLPLVYQLVSSQKNTGIRIYFASSIKTDDSTANSYFDEKDEGKMALILAPTFDDDTIFTRDTGYYYTTNQNGLIVSLNKTTAQQWVSHYENNKKIKSPIQEGNLPDGDTKSLWYTKMEFLELIEEIGCLNRNKSANIIGLVACLTAYHKDEPLINYFFEGQQKSFDGKEMLTLVFSFLHKVYTLDSKTYTAISEIEISEAVKEVRRNQFALLLAPVLTPEEDYDSGVPCPPRVCDGSSL
jgi:hypothetical protein